MVCLQERDHILQICVFEPTHDVDVDVSLVLSLSIAEDDLVDTGLVSSRVDHRQVDRVTPKIETMRLSKRMRKICEKISDNVEG